MAFEKVSKSLAKDSQTAQSSSGFTSRPFAPLVKQVTQIPAVQLSSSDQTGQQQEFVNKDLETNRRTKLREIPIFPPHYNREPQRIQRKLIIGQAGDKYEQEADRVAHQVVQHLNTIPSQSVSTIQPKSEFAQRMKGKVLQRAASSGQIEMQTNKFGLKQEPKVPFIQGEDQKISQIQPKVIQRITDTEARENLSKDWLEYYDAWLEMTGAESEEFLDILLSPLTIEELQSKLQYYKNRLGNEDKPENKWEYFVPNITPFANQIDNLLANSKEFGQYIKERQTEGVNSADNVEVLGENDYLEALVKEFKAAYDSGKTLFSTEINTRLGELRAIDENSFDSYLKLNLAKFAESGTDGLTSMYFGKPNKTIYLRKSTLNNITELFTHELMHRYSNLKIRALGKSINEGLTELFKRKFLVSLKFSIADRIYEKEVELVEKLIKVFFNNDYTILKEAYFNGNVEPIIQKALMKLNKEQYCILFTDSSDVQEKIRIFEKIGGEQEANQEIEASQTNDLTSKETEQEADEEIEESEIDDLTSEEGEQEADEQVEAEASQTNEPASEEGEQEADEQVEVPRAAKRKREEDEDKDKDKDKDEIESQRRAPKSRKIEK